MFPRSCLQTLGNHEFDFGVTVLGSYIRNLSEAIPMLGGCNVDTSQEPALRGLLKKWLVLTHKTPKKNFKVTHGLDSNQVVPHAWCRQFKHLQRQ